MPKPVVVSIDVATDRQSTFDFLDRLANHEPFNDHLLRSWEYSGPDRGVGARARARARTFGVDDVIDIEVIEAAPPVRIVERNMATRAGRAGLGTYTLEVLPSGGTRITFEYRWIVTPTADRVIAPIVRAFIRRNNTTAMRRLADQLESATGRRPT